VEDEEEGDGKVELTEVANSNMEVSDVTDVRLSSTSQDGGVDLIAVRAALDGAPCSNALVDTGASASFVHRRWVAQHKDLRIIKRGVPFRVTLADGSSTQIDEVVHVKRLAVFTESAPCDLIVMDQLRYDVVIGLPWLRAAGVTIEFGPVVKWAGRPVTATSARDAKEATRQLLATAALDREYGNRAQRLLAKYATVFAKQLPKRVETALSRSFAYELKLEPDVQPIVERERRRSPEDIKVMIDTVQEMEAAGILEDSESSWSSQVVLVKKKDGTKRMAIDYRRLNAATVPITEPIPLPEVMFAHLQGARIFSKMDLLKGFWQIPVKEGSRPYLAFATPLGLKQPTRMPFGIRNAPAVFQREMQRVLKDRLYKGVMVYIDDILIYSGTADEHEQLVEWVLRRLQDEGYYAHPDKCEFFRHQVEFLGHVISASGVAVQQHKVQRVREWPVPQTKRDVKSFLGMTGYYRKFIQSYSRVALPLTDLTADDAKWRWGEAEKASFQLLQDALSKAPVLVHADPAKQYVIQTDASAFAIGGFLAQHQLDGSLRPIAYWSRKLNGAETRYSATERELLALVEAVDEWRVYVEGSPHAVLLRSDHRPLMWLNNKPELSSRLFRWIERLDGHSFRIEHVAGKANSVADALSRRADLSTAMDDSPSAIHKAGSRVQVELAVAQARRAPAPTDRVTRSQAKRTEQQQSTAPQADAEEANLPAPTAVVESAKPASAEPSHEEPEAQGMQREGKEDAMDLTPAASSTSFPDLEDFKAKLQAAAQADVEYKEWLDELRPSDGLERRDGLLWSKSTGVLWVPNDRTLKTELMGRYHDAAGHFGQKRTVKKICDLFYWNRIRDDVEDYCRSCEACAAHKSSNQLPAGLLRPLPIPDEPWQVIGIDFVGPLPKSTDGYDFILVVVDKFSKYMLLAPCRTTIDMPHAAKLLLNMLLPQHAMPEAIISDRDPRFTGSMWAEAMKSLGMKLKTSTAYHPQTDGQTERTNRTMQTTLAIYAEKRPKDWPDFLQTVAAAYNDTVHESTGQEPARILGRNTRDRAMMSALLGDARLRTVRTEEARKLLDGLKLTWEEARERMIRQRARMKTNADKKRREVLYKPGDMVFLSTRHLRMRGGRKLKAKWTGPFQVIKVLGEGLDVTLDLPKQYSRLHPTFHIENVKPYHESERTWPGRKQPPRALPRLVKGKKKWDVERVVDKVVEEEEAENGQMVETTWYLLKWKNCSDSENSWQRAEELNDCWDLVEEYEAGKEANGESDDEEVTLAHAYTVVPHDRDDGGVSCTLLVASQ
jgi:transposase InsO family protein